MSIVLSAQKRHTLRRPIPRRRKPRPPPSPLPRRSPRSLSLFISGHLLRHAFEFGGTLEVRLLALGTARGGPRRRRRGVLRLPHRHEAEHALHELQVALDLEKSLRGTAVLEEGVERPSLFPDQVGQLAHAPVLDLAH